jgi:hypothetical protein
MAALLIVLTLEFNGRDRAHWLLHRFFINTLFFKFNDERVMAPVTA